MRGQPEWMYKYRPQHIVFDTLCMVLQKRAFRLEKSGEAKSIAFNQYNPNNSQHVLVREIAFGPDSDPAIRGVALWFNIPEHEVAECTPQQAKRFRWKKNPKNDEQRTGSKASVFDARECFIMIRPHDRDAFEFATDILDHRYKTVKAEGLSTLRERFETLKDLRKEKDQLQETFCHSRRHWITWEWPINNGRQKIDDDTPVPPVEAEYTPIIDEGAMSDKSEDDDQVVKGSAIQAIWLSFVSQDLDGTMDPQSKIEADAALTAMPNRRRLPIFARLGYGKPVSHNRSLPHIVQSRVTTSTDEYAPRESERCWRALLIKQERHHSQNEWEIVRDHFQNARCKKVLSIIQQ
jgi:hypothetical protein